MGCPDKFYKCALRSFSWRIRDDTDKSTTEPQETHELEKLILAYRDVMDPKEFYFLAGRVWEAVAREADQGGCDSFNACIGGLNEFERLIGLDDGTD